MIDTKIISSNIGALRKSSKLTQEEFADLFQVSHQAVSKWETGNAVPDLDILDQFASHFKITIDQLLYGLKYEEDCIEFEFGTGIIPYVALSAENSLMKQIPMIRKQMKEAQGKDLPRVHLKDNIDLDPLEYRITYGERELLHNSLELIDEDKRSEELMSYLKFVIDHDVLS